MSVLRLIRFGSELIQSNPHIRKAFAKSVKARAKDANIPADIETYEATAVEWCLLGLVELRPPGVIVECEGEQPR